MSLNRNPSADEPARPLRADARRNVDALIEAARSVFDTSGVDAPAKEITDLAGVGVGTLYRHFPQRSDLVKAVVESGIDAVAEAGPALSAEHEPVEALSRWIQRFTELLATKRGLASALHSGDPAFAGLPGYFLQRLGPTLAALLDAAVADGAVRDDVSAEDLLHALTQLCQPVPGRGPEHNQRIVAVLLDGLRAPGRRRSGRRGPPLS
jgi:AcrR family transcriptional regulator